MVLLILIFRLCFFFFCFQGIAHHLPAVGTAASLTTLTCMCLVGTTPTTMSQEAQRMKTIHFSGSYGGIILQQAAGSRSEQRATCPQSWHQCQVKHCVFSTSEHFTSVYTLLVFHVPPPPPKGNKNV